MVSKPDFVLLFMFFLIFPNPLDGTLIIESYTAAPNPEYMSTNITLSKDGVLNMVNEVFKELKIKIMVINYFFRR
jgi:hypothetical protein